MANDLGLLKKTQEVQESKEGEGRGKIQQIKALVNTLYKGTTEKDGKGDDGGGRESGGGGNSNGGEGGGGGGNGKDDRDQNSIRLIFSAIKNELYNLASKNPVMNANRERLRANGSTPALHFSEKNGAASNATDHEDSGVLLDDIVFEPLTENPFQNFLNRSLNLSGVNDVSGKNFTNRTLAEEYGGDRNDSLANNLDAFTSSLYDYNVAELLTGNANENFSSFGDVNGSRGIWNSSNLTADWDGHGNSTWQQQSSMTGTLSKIVFSPFDRPLVLLISLFLSRQLLGAHLNYISLPDTLR